MGSLEKIISLKEDVMQDADYRAMVVEETEDKQYVRRITRRNVDSLPPGEVLVRVRFSSLNFKDALSATGNKGVTRRYPHTPGIDAAGEVVESSSAEFEPGDTVIVTSYDLGMNTSGGFGQFIRVPAGWVVPLPAQLSLAQSMSYGTAGFTAGMSIHRLVAQGVSPGKGEILVTGATGGVGSLAVAILARIGYDVVGVTGKTEGKVFLGDLGAKEVLSREGAIDESGRPLLKGRWAGVVDTVGGEMLATAIKSTKDWGSVTCCGLVGSPNLPTSVFPFILRGVSLHGIDSQNCPMALRRGIWQSLAGEWKIDGLEALTREVGLDDLSPEIDRILKGGQIGRVRVALG
jgi:putative YhdH/YhfP family quinone oxidoreductase